MLAIILAIFLLTNPQLSKNKYVSSDFKLEKGKHNEFGNAGSDIITVHYEACQHLQNARQDWFCEASEFQVMV